MIRGQGSDRGLLALKVHGGLVSLIFAIVLMITPSFVWAEGSAHNGAKPGGEALQPTAGSIDQVENSVVKVFATARSPDPFRPWTKQAPQETTGSGVIIEGKRILTNAHVVLYASQVQVQANQAGDKILATVEAIAPGIDLAILKPEDETFFNARPPLKRTNSLPQIKDTVMAYGYPTGGTSLSITKGIVSRIEFAPYNYPVSGLRIQIDAAVNPGNSGGPTVAEGKMVGLTFSHLKGSENVGYIIPCEEIELFLEDVADGKYDGKPAMFDELQTLENTALRSFLKLDKSVEGIVVHQPFKVNSTPVLREWDVITKIGDTAIDNEGMMKMESNLRVRFQYLIQKIAKNGKARLTVIRDGASRIVDLPVGPNRHMLIPSLQGAYPPYFIYGPLVFSRATVEFVAGLISSKTNILGSLSFAASPLITRLGDVPAFDGEELVVVSSPFFPHRLAKGYSNPGAGVVKTVNDIAIKNLRHLVEVLRDSGSEFMKVEFARHGGETLLFPRAAMLTATEEILTDNGIRTQGSPDLLAIWNAKPAQTNQARTPERGQP
jgi:S1-C subfamily serine protease